MLSFLRRTYKKIRTNPFYIYIVLYSIFLIVLSFFRNASADESYYLKETVLIAELLRKGIWIGDYGVGLHGILFKLPTAIVFLILGKPSVFIATLFTIINSIGAVFLFYKIVKRFFMKGNYAIWTTVLFSAAFHFLETTISFNRDIPAVFAVLLFLYLFLEESNMWMIGLSLLLMLDAKEHVFLTVAPIYAVYLFVDNFYKRRDRKIWDKLKDFLIKCFSGYLFSSIWIILMFLTSIIPMNMFVASISGLTKIGLEWSVNQFSVDVASRNLMDEEGKEIVKLSDISLLSSIANCNLVVESEDVKNDVVDDDTTVSEKEKVTDMCGSFSCSIIHFIDIILSYIGKILYPRTFSFISIPKVIALPAVIYAFSLLTIWVKKKDRKAILPMILLFNVSIVILRASHGRYLLCVAPIFLLFFVMFIKDGLSRPRFFRNILIATTVFVLMGLFFESTFIFPKIVLEIVLLFFLWLIWIVRNRNKKLLDFTKQLFLFALASGMFLTFLAFSYSIGQISSYIKYGYDGGTEIIVKEIPSDERIWINNYGSDDLASVLRWNSFNEPEWNWELADWIPKKSLLKTYGTSNTFSFDILNMEDFEKQIKTNKIKKVVLAVSLIKEDELPWIDYAEDFSVQSWLSLEKTLELKNRIVYIYDVKD